ncbi:DUF3857 domain-containing protein [Aequorivita sublithincola]|uniref:DUF3857 domain-containing protein n=1 Tax=Aequorivita sublithincola TaxID=101385 RepID=UPI0002D8DD7C|nr:DUF3857 domain-containing protein [Aequorivita sublithincola]
MNAQKPRFERFGKPTQEEFALKKYEPEPDSPGIILYESGNYYVKSVGLGIYLVKEIYRKIKVFDAKKFDYSTVEISYYEGNSWSKEEILEYEAITHNGTEQSVVSESGFFKTQETGSIKTLKFTFPNVQDGSILEYKYTILSPFFYYLNGWEFQHELPTIYSLFQTILPVNLKYNRILYGDQELAIKNLSLKEKGCLLPDKSKVDSEVHLYAMENIPSFTEENYMLAKKNYVSKLVYEPLSFRSFQIDWREQVFTRNWKDVDKRFENDDDFGEQLNQNNYFRRKIPNDILKIENDLDRAKAVYKFIQEEYTWNKRFFNYEIKVKDAFKDKLGSVAAINLSLVNALEAARLNAMPVLLSIRNNGLPTELYPVLSNFNYVLAVLMINDEKILLDGTDKQAPFGLIPFRALNVQGRVMDFSKGSYWMPIEPFKQNIDYVNSQITAQTDGNFTGKVNQAGYGYIALKKRNTIDEESLQEYIKTQQKDKAGIEIEDYQVEGLYVIENPLKENYTISIEPETVGDKVILYPFFNKTYISENPFKMKERSYPMDFGFPFSNTYLISIDLGEVYEVEQLPKSRSIKLPNDDGECSVTYVAEGSKINIRFNMKLNAFRFPNDAYASLKEFFGTIVTTLKNEPITLKKI